jgi:hypothetical protein
MNKRILLLISLTVIIFAIFSPFCVSAETSLDPNAEASLTVSYQKDGAAFPNLPVRIYRVAQAFPSGIFQLIEPFAFYPVNIHDIMAQEQWINVANTLNAYIVANQVTADAEVRTNEEGIAEFADLKTGLYLVEEVIAENTKGSYVFNRFMVYLPTPQADGSYNYAVEAKPKCVSFVSYTEYRVTKLWQDAEHQQDRPEEVLIDIYKNGVLWDSQLLNAEKDWSYNWYIFEENQDKWTVVERSVTDMYTVTIQQNGSCFLIINTHKANVETPDNPQTGDTANVLLYVILMCISGIMLIILGIYSRRHKET